jgi:hypothetical protein
MGPRRVEIVGHGPVEVGLCAVASLLPLPRVVDEKLGNLSQGPSFLAEVDNDADPAVLRSSHALLRTITTEIVRKMKTPLQHRQRAAM